MKKSRIHIPEPRSSFISIQCPECGTSRVVFSASSSKINCEKCNTLLLENTGGLAKIHGTNASRVD
ncbi:MAG TPA: 30S ribosomal protein S27e [Nitrososphaerales archaeon]|jgi:small subunit ribosomal protein S27e|nr:30S ribosomal protein S27e [Nitrososphaerales archaeon]HIM82536.1 30S ribosomal protein S27e [Nitrososphaerales archaeon]